jgi:ATP sulfurylase
MPTKKIGLIPMSGKPVHAGHWKLIQLAAEENDEVRLFVSLSDRKRPGEVKITGAGMMKIWHQFLEPALPGNVSVVYGGSPVRHVYEDLENAEAEDSDDTFQIYSDKEDILKYTDASLGRAAPNLFASGQIIRRGVDRNETVNVSGTKMREMLSKGNVKQFAALLPPPVQENAQEIIDVLKASTGK